MTTTVDEKEKDDSEQLRVVEDEKPTIVEDDEKTSGPHVSPSSVLVSGLGSGELEQTEPIEPVSTKKKPRKRRQKVRDSEAKEEERRSTPSGRKLTALAKPDIRTGPEVKLQQKIVQKLEKAIPLLDEKAVKVREKHQQALFEWNQKYLEGTHTPEEGIEHLDELNKRSRMLPPDQYDVDILYLGSIELSNIPGTKSDEKSLLKKARLVASPDHALKADENGSALPPAAGVSQAIVQNTLRTMIVAGQMDYLRTAGFVGPDWKIVIEIHYYRSRSKTQANLHKDTLGQTLFVNLNYTNDQPMPGPEFVVNPPLVKTHEDKLGKTLPKTFLDDLEQTRGMDQPTSIETGILPPHGVVSFVDETIHHATPLLGHREVRIEKVREFLQEDKEFRKHFAGAKAAYDEVQKKPQGEFKVLDEPKTFAEAFTAKVPETTKDIWRALMELCSGQDGTRVQRPELVRLGLTNEQVDRLLSGYGPDTFNSVNIPSRARDDGQLGRVPMTTDTKGKKPLQLTRQMSQKALAKELPVDPGGPRRFFRTWIRAVPTDT